MPECRRAHDHHAARAALGRGGRHGLAGALLARLPRAPARAAARRLQARCCPAPQAQPALPAGENPRLSANMPPGAARDQLRSRRCADGPLPTGSPRCTARCVTRAARAWGDPRARRRHYAPALALSLLAPKLTWSEAETAAGVREGALVRRADDEPLSPHDVKRLQARARLGCPSQAPAPAWDRPPHAASVRLRQCAGIRSVRRLCTLQDGAPACRPHHASLELHLLPAPEARCTLPRRVPPPPTRARARARRTPTSWWTTT